MKLLSIFQFVNPLINKLYIIFLKITSFILSYVATLRGLHVKSLLLFSSLLFKLSRGFLVLLKTSLKESMNNVLYA